MPVGRFSTESRIRKRSEFRRIQETGERVVSDAFVFMLRQSEAAGPRIGITASRRVGNAVQRNRAKRLVREAFRATRAFWPVAADVVVIVRHGLGERTLGDVVREWQRAEPRLQRVWDRLIQKSERRAPVTEPLLVKKSC